MKTFNKNGYLEQWEFPNPFLFKRLFERERNIYKNRLEQIEYIVSIYNKTPEEKIDLIKKNFDMWEDRY